MSSFAQNIDQETVYFKTLHLKNVRCFKGEHTIDFSDGKDNPAQWTVILGNNNTGKTTVLRALADLSPVILKKEKITKGEFSDKNFIPRAINWYVNSPINGNSKDCKIASHFYETRKKNGNIVFEVLQPNYWYVETDQFGKRAVSGDLNLRFENFIVYGYGAIRRGANVSSSDENSLPDYEENIKTASLFSEHIILLNVEQWLLDLDLAQSKDIKGAKVRYEQVKNIFCKGLLPDVTEIKITTIPDKSSYETFPEFLTPYGWLRLRDLGYGYQATFVWVADLAKRMFDRYPDLENPLHGPAVVLVDEIDLHLHPEWQRKLVKYLSDLFPNTQFIVTAHSPLIVQSANDVNVVMLEEDKPNGSINIRQRFGSFQGWTVDEILTELMNLGERTRSDRYIELMEEFENAVLEDNYKKAQNIYNELDSILSPSSYQRKILQIQMSSIIPVSV